MDCARACMYSVCVRACVFAWVCIHFCCLATKVFIANLPREGDGCVSISVA